MVFMELDKVDEIIRESGNYGPDAQSFVETIADTYKKLYAAVGNHLTHTGYCNDVEEDSMCSDCHTDDCTYCAMATLVGGKCTADCKHAPLAPGDNGRW